MSREEYHRWKKIGILPKSKTEGGTVSLRPQESRSRNKYGVIHLNEEGFCPYLTAEGLCQIQQEYGEKEMTWTCRIFPRWAHSYFGRVECSLSLGCEKVLELLLEEKEGIRLEEGKAQRFEGYGCAYDISDRRKYPKLQSYYDIQTLSIAILQSENRTMEERLLLFGVAIGEIESFYREGRGGDTAAYISQFLEMLMQPKAREVLPEIKEGAPLSVWDSVMSAMLTFDFEEEFRKLFLKKITLMVNKKKTDNVEYPEMAYYQEQREVFAKRMRGKEYFLENIMVMYLLWSNIPFKDLEKSMWENYLYLVWVYVIVKGCLITFLTEDNTEEDMVDCCVTLFRQLGHNDENFDRIIDTFCSEGDTIAHVAILLKSL